MEGEQGGMKENGEKIKKKMWKVRKESWRREDGKEMKIMGGDDDRGGGRELEDELKENEQYMMRKKVD